MIFFTQFLLKMLPSTDTSKVLTSSTQTTNFQSLTNLDTMNSIKTDLTRVGRHFNHEKLIEHSGMIITTTPRTFSLSGFDRHLNHTSRFLNEAEK